MQAQSIPDQIHRLRSQGLSYIRIAKELCITRFKVEYYCNPNRKEILRKAAFKYRKKIPIQKKVASFHAVTPIDQRVDKSFNYKEFIHRIGETPTCYLTGDPININDCKVYSIDHIIPVGQGGSNDISNAGLCTTDINQLKMNRTPNQLIEICIKLLQYNGYIVDTKK
jgi:hypothetical protein